MVICQFNLQAINEDLLQDFESRLKNWKESQKIADVIAKKGPFLKLYNNYIRYEHLKICALPFGQKLFTRAEISPN